MLLYSLGGTMPQNFTLYTIYELGQQWDDEPFDLTRLPLEVVEGVRIEDLRPLLREDAFDYVTPQMGTWAVDHLKRSNYAFVHRYEAGHRIVNGELVQEHELMNESTILLRNLAECLRLIRPMR